MTAKDGSTAGVVEAIQRVKGWLSRTHTVVMYHTNSKVKLHLLNINRLSMLTKPQR